MTTDGNDEFDLQVLAALLEGFRARAGAKERHQALTEYEVARRIGIVAMSYVEYENSSEREAVRSSLSRLQRQGMARAVAFSGRYETFVPSETALEAGNSPEGEREETAGPALANVPAQGVTTRARSSEVVEDPLAPSPGVTQVEASLPTTFEGRLDEMIRLLRSIDHHLERITRS